MIHYVLVSILIVISTLLIRSGLRNARLLPEQASTQAQTVDWLFGVHIDLIAFLFSLIGVFLLYSIIVFRKRKGDESDGPYVTGNTRLEMIWTAIPLAVVLYLAFIGAQSLSELERRDPDALKVDVISSQWSWRFDYPAYGISSPDLVLPVNQQVLLLLQSTDVIHSFWVPEFRVKQDALPGGKEFIRELRITPNETGIYKVRCAELCGTSHYAMVADVVVIEQEEFEDWVAEEQKGCDLGAELCGQRWATNYGCFSCHSVDGSDLIGPSWLGLASETVQAEDGSSSLVDDDYLLEAIVNPNAKIRSGYPAGIMPQNFAQTLTEQQLEEIIAFIKSLQ